MEAARANSALWAEWLILNVSQRIMLAPRWIAFLAALAASITMHLSYARLVGIWERPKINEASEVLGYYFWFGYAFAVGLAVVALVAFPQAIAADRFFQKKKKSRFAPYILFGVVSLLITGVLLATLKGEKHVLDFPSVLFYFAVAPSVVWKLAYEIPKKQKG